MGIPKQHIKLMLEREHTSDCTFIIGNQKIKAHKTILSCANPIFEKMFKEPWTKNEIQITDISVNDFKQLIDYIYINSIRFKSVMNAWSLFSIGHRYLMNNFLDICINYIKENLTISNLVLSYEYADFYNIKSVKQRWLKDICWYTKGIFSEEYYYHMKPSTLAEILENKLNIDKTNLCRNVLYWACNECDNRNIKKIPENVLKVLSDSKLDYLLSSQLESFKEVNLSQETNQLILESYKLLNKQQEKFLNDRKTITINNKTMIHWTTFCKFRTVYKIASRVPFRQSDFRSTLVVSRKIILFGLVVCRDNVLNLDFDKSVEIIIIKIKGPKTTWTQIYKHSDLNSTTCYVPIDELIVIEAEKCYRIEIVFSCDIHRSFGKSVVCYYMSPVTLDEENGFNYSLYENFGGVIGGLCYYFS